MAGTIAVSTQARLQRTPDGAVWTVAGPAHSFWTRYLSAFERVRLLARVIDVPVPPVAGSRVDGSGVGIWPLPYYVGPSQFLLRRTALRRSLRDAVDGVEAVILRVPSPIATLALPILRHQRRGYALEVVGDPQDVLGHRAVRHPLRPLLRHWAVRGLREQCLAATAVAYDTETRLQDRYPPGPHTIATWYSSIDLRPEAFVTEAHTPPPPGTPVTLISAGSLDHGYQGIDVLLLAMCELTRGGVLTNLVHLGDGRFRPRLERLAAQHDLTDQVTFTGDLPAVGVRPWLDRADLFVVASPGEESSRPLIEAMARGLPAVGTLAGGTAELLDADCLAAAGDPAALAEAIGRLFADPQRMADVAAGNMVRSQDYRTEVLAPRRANFYRTIRMACRPARVSPAVAPREHASA
ncbi:glycosyltransferase [Micromonospora sp. NBC_01813]|uniref:glycosyltransferase n=1 Tax=Micromonospora sp. NBC_01813 TaxID=2975988 RepID=UPI002DDC6842|nr:glycosyltransferase [Micromonospora sp. NBC_01813]WSA10420.1 glycosyltransferase [Micromonospora sp. NBC_01813]